MAELKFPNVNTIIISGRLTRDVDLRYTSGGTPVANLSIAFDRNYQKNGEWVQDTSFMDVTVWSNQGERCATELHKGSPVLIEGYLQTRTFTDRNNNNRKVAEIVARRVNFLEKSSSYQNQPKEQKNDQTEELKADVTDDDVPF